VFRILLANFIVEVLPLLLVVCGVILLAKRLAAGAHWTRYLGLTLISLPVGIVLYIVSGIAAAAIRGEGHFYSVPFGGYTVSNNTALGASLFLWIALVFVTLAAIVRPKP
jgi:hypothetical protein